MVKFSFLYIILLYTIGSFSQTGSINSDILLNFYDYSFKKDSTLVSLSIISKSQTKHIKLKQNSIFDTLINYHKDLLSQGRIFNLIVPVEVKIENKKKEYVFKVERDEVQKIDTLIFFSSKNNFPTNIKKRLNRYLLGKPLNLFHITKAKQKIGRLYPNAVTDEIRPVIYKDLTGLKIKYHTVNYNSLSGEVNAFTQNNKTFWQGHLQVKLHNVFKKAEKVSLFWKKYKDIQEIDSDVYFPYIGGSLFYIKGNYFFKTGQKLRTSSEYELATGMVYWNWNFGLSFQHIKTGELNTQNFIGFDIYKNFNNHLLDAYGLKKQLAFQIKKNDNTYVYSWNMSYQIPVSKKIFFYLKNEIYKNTGIENLYQIKPNDNLYLYSQNSPYNQVFYTNFKAISAYSQSIVYFTTSFFSGHNFQKYKQWSIGMGLAQQGKNGLLSLEINYMKQVFDISKHNGFHININQTIKL